MLFSDLDSVLDEAVRSYRIVKRLRTLKRGAPTDYTVKNLAQDYPDHYMLLDSQKNIRFTGKCPGDILEDYLREFDYPEGSDLWFRLAHVVIERGESGDSEII